MHFSALLPQDLTYSVPSNSEKGQQAYLLQNVSGYLEMGQMAALVRLPPLFKCTSSSMPWCF